MTGPESDFSAGRLVAAAALLRASGMYRVLDRFEPQDHYHTEPWGLGDEPPARVGVFVDLETTGLDTAQDEIIEFGAVPFTYRHATGEVYEVLSALSGFEQPSREIPEDVQQLTGITPSMVQGHRIDDAAVNALVADASIIIAHNAEFDRHIAERRFPVFATKPWACSQREVPWAKFGVTSLRLEHVLAGACGMFSDHHRAAQDCHVGVHCLAAARLDGRPALAYLLDSARQPTVRLYAMHCPFPTKDLLKLRQPRYRWSDGATQPKAWYVDVKPDAVDTEVAWLRVAIYRSFGVPVREYQERMSPVPAKGEYVIVAREISAKDRYSARVG
jgi:DNA polymerase III subunit epsilon